MSSQEESIRTAINRILGGQKFDPHDDNNLEMEPVDPNDKVIFVLEDHLCRDLFRFMTAEIVRLDEEIVGRFRSLNDQSTIGEKSAIENDFLKAKRRIEVLANIFWGMVKELHHHHDLYNYPGLSLRSGWQVVAPAPRGRSIFDLLNLGPGFNPDPEDNDF